MQEKQTQNVTNKDKMESSRSPLFDCLLSIVGDVVLDLFLLHKRRKNRLVDGVICRMENDKPQTKKKEKADTKKEVKKGVEGGGRGGGQRERECMA